MGCGPGIEPAAPWLVDLLGGRGDDAPARPAQGGFRENAPAPKQGSSKAEEKSPVFQGEDNFTDDDIPF